MQRKYTTVFEFEPTIHQATGFINSLPKKRSSIMYSREILNKYLRQNRRIKSSPFTSDNSKRNQEKLTLCSTQ